MKKIEPYFVDDSFPDLSRFEGMSDEELRAEIKHLEEDARKNREQMPRLAAIS